MPHRKAMNRAALAALATLLALAAWTPGSGAADAKGGALQAELDAAVQAYDAGRIDLARRRLLALSARGVPAADYNLAVMHLLGQMPQPDRREALRLMRRAAEHGFVTAQYGLGQLHENGEVGPRDLAQANRWYQRAAENGSVDAQVAIGTAFYLGRGTGQDLAQAARWYREAAKGGDIGAQYLIASMYEGGHGVARDLRLARYWYSVAAANGDEAAPGKVKELDARLAEPGRTIEPGAKAPP